MTASETTVLFSFVRVSPKDKTQHESCHMVDMLLETHFGPVTNFWLLLAAIGEESAAPVESDLPSCFKVGPDSRKGMTW
jgi:hypothetical protein